MMKPPDASRGGDLLPDSRPLARLAGRAVLAAAAVTLAAAPAAAWAQAAAGTGTASAVLINCPPPNPKVQVMDSVSDC
jgi:hypothetical protein